MLDTVEEPAEDCRAEPWCCIGFRRNETKPPGQYWAPLDEAGRVIVSRAISWAKPLVAYARPAQIYIVNMIYHDGKACRVYTSGDKAPRYKQEYDGPDALDIVALSKLVETAWEAEKRAKKAGPDSELRRAIAPLKAIMQRQIGANRRVMLAIIMDELLK
jgi:hypothetical protein